MPFKKRYLCAEIALILCSGLFLAAIPSTAQAQLPEYSCRPNAAADGWVCESSQSPGSRNSVRTTTRPPLSSGNSASRPAASSQQNRGGVQTAASVEDRASKTIAEQEIAAQSSSDREYELDWVPKEDLNEAQLEALDRSCCGAFIDPKAGTKEAASSPATSATNFDATQGVSSISQNLISIERYSCSTRLSQHRKQR